MQVETASDFQLDADAIHALLRHVVARRGELETVVERAARGEGLSAADIALLWGSTDLDTDALYELAVTVRAASEAGLETFSPLYMTNTCDAACKMCGMRRDNDALRRQTVDVDTVDEQLQILRQRGMQAVALLTGEYRADRRGWAIEYVNRALRRTQTHAFRHVLINVGSIDDQEYEQLLDGIARRADGAVQPKLTMCTFQEAYARPVYEKFMGRDANNPRADYDRRLANFDRARRAGMRVANPGILVGLNPDLGFELVALSLHAQHLRAHGMEVYLSVPRLRQIAGQHDQRGAGDDAFIRLVSVLAVGLPQCKIVLTTRESAAIQRRLVPIVTVLSAGSAAVAPYTDTGAHFPLETSQFEVIDQRPFEEILGEYLARGASFENFEPRAGA